MKKKTISIIAAVLALTLAFGVTAFAASPTTANVDPNAGAQTSTTVPEYIIPRGNGYARATDITATSDYAGVTDPAMIATIVKNPVGDPFAAYMNTYKQALSGKIILGPYKIRMYKAGQSIWTGFGTFNASLAVGNQYNGLAATAHILYGDGTTEVRPIGVVNRGRVSLALSQMATVLIELN